LRARFYNPVIGRFTQEDTYRGDGLNLYAYCENNPVRYLDSSGYNKECPESKDNNFNRYPKRTAEAQAECQKVVDVGNAIKAFDSSGKVRRKNPVTSVFLHEDGTVSVGISGEAEGNMVSKTYSTKLQNTLNEHAGYNKYTVSNITDEELLSKIKPTEEGNIPGNCAEPKVATVAHYNESPIVGFSARYYKVEGSSHKYNDDIYTNEMKPCDTCDYNEEVYMKYANNK